MERVGVVQISALSDDVMISDADVRSLMTLPTFGLMPPHAH